MKLQAEANGETHIIEIQPDGSQLRAIIDDRPIEAEISEPEPGVFLFKMAGQIVQAYTYQNRDGSIVSINGKDLEVKITDPKRLRGSSDVLDSAGGRAEIKNAMPGKVVRILIESGTKVEKGDGLIVVEAMKMQNEMRSPKHGHILEIRVSEGDTVSAGDVLMIVE
jgi:biotin carboxyl carrier protein